MNKKGQAKVANITKSLSVIAVVIASVALAIFVGYLMLSASLITLGKFTERLQTTTDYTINNYSISLNNPLNATSSWYIPEITTATFNSMSTSVRIVNGTAGDYWLVLSGNYTAYSNGSIILTSISSYDNLTLANVTYTYTLNNNPDEFQTSKNVTKGIAEVANLSDTISIVAAISIMIVIIFGVLAFFNLRRNR